MDRYLSGIKNEEEPQSPIGTESDPQRIVLRQFLNDTKSKGELVPIVDLGSGQGVLAHEICMVWPGSEKPEYVAVDLLDPLNQLQIPVELHNKSRKFEFAHFLDHELVGYAQEKSVFVLRNVFHELDIAETAKLLSQLKVSLDKHSVVYVQDMVNLPIAERNHVGWEPDGIEKLFQYAGFDFHHIPIEGRSGTRWFAGTMHSNGPIAAEIDILRKCYDLRLAQKTQMLSEMKGALDYSVENSDETYVRLSLEISALDRQLDAVSSIATQDPVTDAGALETPSMPIPLSTSTRLVGGAADIAMSNFSAVTGCVGALRDKDHIDFPKLFEHSRSRLWFAGYSQKLTFRTDENRIALRDAIQRGVDLRILILQPNSAMVELAGRNRPANGEARLRQGIFSTIDAAKRFHTWLSESGYTWPRSNIRFVDSPFPGSYFFVDESCFFSTYTRQTSGSRAPCLIYERRSPTLAGYFDILEEDFHFAWDSADVDDNGSDKNA